jgi:hypothetical protein
MKSEKNWGYTVLIEKQGPKKLAFVSNSIKLTIDIDRKETND